MAATGGEGTKYCPACGEDLPEAAQAAPALVYALWTEDRHDQGTPQLRGIFATLEAAQARAAADSTYPLPAAWRPAVGYLDNHEHLGHPALEAVVTYQHEQVPGPGYPFGGLATIWACTWTIEPTRVQG